MFTRINVKNFNSLKDVTLDMQSKKQAKRIVMVYGENGSGKTNLIKAFYVLGKTLDTLLVMERWERLMAEQVREAQVIQFFQSSERSLAQLIKDNRTIGSSGNMVIDVSFQLDGKLGNYVMVFNDQRIVSEKLTFQIGERRGVYFEVEAETSKCVLSPSIFKDAEYRADFQRNVEAYWGKHTVLAILVKELQEKNREFLERKLHPNLFCVLEFMCTFACQLSENNTQKRRLAGNQY
ncbi:MAG: AAA family ATPase, partial [Bacilli bacterium]